MIARSPLAATSRSLSSVVGVMLLAGSVAVSGQTAFQQDASTIDDLIANGQYGRASRFVKIRLDRMRLLEAPFDEAAPLLAYAGKLDVEIGRLSDAAEALKAAEASARIFYYWEPAVAREQAALDLARGDHAAAAAAAAKAYRLSHERGYSAIRAAYCENIEALAQLRMGNVSQAEQLVLEALKAVPNSGDLSLFFAPRILYTACLVESYRSNRSVAEAQCLRGMKMAERSRAESRDSSLGHLAFAESYFQSRDFVRSRESSLKALELTYRLFGPQHQDAVEALQMLALVDMREGKVVEARKRAQNAIKIAKELFGEGSLGVIRPTRTLNEVMKSE